MGKPPAPRAADLAFIPASRSCHTSGFGISVSALPGDCLVGLVVKASASRAEDPRFESRLRRDFSGSSHTSDLNCGTPVATVPRLSYRVSAGPVSVYCDWVR